MSNSFTADHLFFQRQLEYLSRLLLILINNISNHPEESGIQATAMLVKFNTIIASYMVLHPLNSDYYNFFKDYAALIALSDESRLLMDSHKLLQFLLAIQQPVSVRLAQLLAGENNA